MKGAAKAALTGAIAGVAFGAIGKGIQAASKAAKVAKGTEAAKSAKYITGSPNEVGKIGERLAGIDPSKRFQYKSTGELASQTP